MNALKPLVLVFNVLVIDHRQPCCYIEFLDQFHYLNIIFLFQGELWNTNRTAVACFQPRILVSTRISLVYNKNSYNFSSARNRPSYRGTEDSQPGMHMRTHVHARVHMHTYMYIRVCMVEGLQIVFILFHFLVLLCHTCIFLIWITNLQYEYNYYYAHDIDKNRDSEAKDLTQWFVNGKAGFKSKCSCTSPYRRPAFCCPRFSFPAPEPSATLTRRNNSHSPLAHMAPS